MTYCIHCGKELRHGAKFCDSCGKPIESSISIKNQRSEEYVGTVYKCPNCGETIDSLSGYCKSCGFELRGIRASSSIKELQHKLELIENSRKSKFNFLKNNPLSNYFGIGDMDEIDKKKIDLIKNYPIPNTKEDLLEFIILSASNINVNVYDQYNTLITKEEKEYSNAWKTKMEQAFEKSKLVLADSKDLEVVKNIYNSKMLEIKKSKTNSTIKGVSMIALPILFLMFIFFIIFINTR